MSITEPCKRGRLEYAALLGNVQWNSEGTESELGVDSVRQSGRQFSNSDVADAAGTIIVSISR